MISRKTLVPIFYKDGIEIPFIVDEDFADVTDEQIKEMDEKESKLNFRDSYYCFHSSMYRINKYNDLNNDIYTCLYILHKYFHNVFFHFQPINIRLIKEISFRLIYYLCIK